MRRTRAEALALVNWKGVFYERYVLDDHVTALEGANGAGKTTVMIAAYVVLLPDMTRLRFTNLGESAATGGDKGIYGRLGEPDSPSYAAIDFRLGTGERLLAGVHLDRRSEPTVELTPFVATGLADDVSLQDVLLDRGEVDAVPDLNRLRELVALSGGRLKTFSKTGDYFAELFDRGVTPLRLTGDEERTKLNEMLRTSMVGGISRALTGGLREFLLRAETGLADTLKRMRGNLDACRRTRLEVESAQRMEEEIHGVYEAGQEMFVAAVHATRERADELHQRVVRARAELETGEARERELARTLALKTDEHAQVESALLETQAALEEASRRLEAVRLAHRIAERIARRMHERSQVAARFEAARDAERAARDARELARARRARAQEEVEAASLGLANFQEGLDQAHRRAAAYEQVSRRLEQAQAGLPELDVQPGTIVATRQDCERRVAVLDREIVADDRAVATAAQQRADHERVLGALASLRGKPTPPDGALELARQALRALRDLEGLANELPQLPAQVEEARVLAARQSETRRAAARWVLTDSPLVTAQDVQGAFAGADVELESTRAALSAQRAGVVSAEGAAATARDAIEQLEALLPRWRDARDQAAQLRGAWRPAEPLASRDDLESLREHLQAERDRVREQVVAAKQRLGGLTARADQLEHGGGDFSPALVEARDAVEGELLAGLFDDVQVEDAARVQAVLGPLAEAIVVDDVARAAERLARAENRPATVWLVDERTRVAVRPEEPEADGTVLMEDAVFVESDAGSRLTTLPEHPTLGRKARAQRVAALRKDIAAAEREVDGLRTEERRVRDGLAAVNRLMGDVALLERPDPSPDLRAAQAELAAAVEATRLCASEVERLGAVVDALVTRRRGLQGLLGDAHLLDLSDQAEVHRTLEQRLAAARAARARLDECVDARSAVEDGLDVLRTPPPTEDQLVALHARLDGARTRRDALAEPLDALRYVEANVHALAWSDAPAALQEQQALRPALEEQLRVAKEALGTAQRGQDTAEPAFETASEAARSADADLKELDAALGRDREELADTGVDDASDDALASAELASSTQRERAAALDRQERALGSEVIEARVRHEAEASRVEGLRSTLSDEEGQWRPHAERWDRLQGEARDAGVLDSAMSAAHLEQTRGSGSVNLYPAARSKGELLVERLAHADGGAERAQAIRDVLASATQESGLAYLRAWLDAREWLRLRVPPQIAEVDDPLETLARVRDHLDRLRERLGQQEQNLRGQSEDVARNIETQRRKARREVGRLNRDLRDVRFGSIHGVRIQVQAVESRERVLRALREGEAQQLLFQSEMPIEDAMAELFKRYGGGQTGGQRLLDYREYLELQVEVVRQASRDWEQANPTRMSTGEAIGVGAAIMMVVLTAWERHANLLRAKRSAGTLRFLFLDEANRLSQDNLGVLFELCESLELQLLIAAPEVAQAQGNTTYHLVRQVDEEGREVVRVAGRRTPRTEAGAG